MKDYIINKRLFNITTEKEISKCIKTYYTSENVSYEKVVIDDTTTYAVIGNDFKEIDKFLHYTTKEFLKYPFFTIEECAAQSGFTSEQYFCREFKKATGLTPLQYRKNHTG